ncbi:uncharacterized protein [Asterias amurensis]|uniref:uncharacterized protein n=1 Tax=Asterias amurensis TaxID=7602 RepID=UPI003AB269AD
MDATEPGQGYEGEMGDAEQEMETAEGDSQVENEPYQDEAVYDMDSYDQGENEQTSGNERNFDISKQVFVGGLVQTTTADELKAYFSAFGTVMDAVVAHDKVAAAKGKSRRSKGFGFVTMSTRDEAIAILNAETHMMDDRTIVVEPSKPTSEIKLRLSLTSLDKDKTTKESLREHFSQFGEVEECILRVSKVDDKMVSRGYGIVKMATDEGTNAVMAANDEKGRQIIDGASVIIKVDRVKLKRYQLYIGNLDPDETTTADIMECFRKFGSIVDVVFSQKVVEQDGVRSTHAFLRMGSDEQHEAILTAQLGEEPCTIHGRKLVIEKDHEKLRRFYVDDIDKDKTFEADLEEYFGAFGVVQESYVFRERSDEDTLGESKGYAMMLMSTVAETDSILKRKEAHILHGKTLTLGRTVSVPPMKEHPTKMTVTCLKDTNITEKVLRDYFGKDSTIKSVQFPLNMATGEKIGFALMELESHHDVEKFAMLRDHVIKGHKVIVNKVKKKKADNLQSLIDRGKERERANRGGFGQYGRDDWAPNWDYGPPQRWGGRPPPPWGPRPPFRGGGPGRWGGMPPRGRAPPPWSRGPGFRGRGRGFGPHEGWGYDGPRGRGRGRGGPAGGGPGAGGWGGSGNEWNSRLNSPKMVRRGWGRHRGRPY